MKISKQKKAFSLIEILAVLFIVSVSLVGVLILAHQSIKAQRLNANTLVAYQLAQEGVELVRILRDNNWRDSDDPFNLIFSAGGYCIDPINLTLHNFTNPCPLYLINNKYQHIIIAEEEDYQDTNFSRLVEISFVSDLSSDLVEANNNLAIEVASTVYWQEFGSTLEYTVSTILYDWYSFKAQD